ncbi:hypothetical protein Y032_0389g526 [Ancylostoma ceylanicum]|uniref:Uncharacterized protein n=1 Tax=Ancylostoma ceylanicum TaxID=53326 RepID=A0A016RS55_9BILA|nr:hypothetical protein Y032_0389g526 [Ancylostoma ceylanicum]
MYERWRSGIDGCYYAYCNGSADCSICWFRRGYQQVHLCAEVPTCFEGAVLDSTWLAGGDISATSLSIYTAINLAPYILVGKLAGICTKTDQNFRISVPGFYVLKERKTAVEHYHRPYEELREFLLYYLANPCDNRFLENGPQLGSRRLGYPTRERSLSVWKMLKVQQY